jgi:hypothetical protein
MHNVVLAVLVVHVSAASVVWAGDAGMVHSPVRLDTPDELAQLRASNPDHYARAERLIRAANALCPPAAPKLEHADADSRNASCGLLLWTSNPPKREISFILDGIRYAARVAITADPPKVLRAVTESAGR